MKRKGSKAKPKKKKQRITRAQKRARDLNEAAASIQIIADEVNAAREPEPRWADMIENGPIVATDDGGTTPVEWNGQLYRVKGNNLKIPDLNSMPRFDAINWLLKMGATA